MAELVLRNVTKQYEDQTVVQNLNLIIPEGAFAAFLGPSGCGKTTTLRMLAGLEHLSSGQLFLGGRLLADANLHTPPEQRNMSMVFQSYALWPHMTVAENIGYPLKIAKIKNEEVQRRVRLALDVVELGQYAARTPQELSGGQRQRVALARCLVSNPKVVLLDEPLANLDRHLRATMEETFREFHKRTGATFVYVTHDQAEAMSLATHIAVMNQGKLLQWGTPNDLYQQPENDWVASFIGQGSILELPLARKIMGQKALTQNCFQFVSHEITTDANRHKVLVRPQHVALSDEGIPGKVIKAIYQGERYLLDIQLEDEQVVTAFHENAVDVSSIVKIQFQQGWALTNG